MNGEFPCRALFGLGVNTCAWQAIYLERAGYECHKEIARASLFLRARRRDSANGAKSSFIDSKWAQAL
jgi:hypothetical protein